jgi:hypothetical protein
LLLICLSREFSHCSAIFNAAIAGPDGLGQNGQLPALSLLILFSLHYHTAIFFLYFSFSEGLIAFFSSSFSFILFYFLPLL